MRIADLVALTVGVVALVSLMGGEGGEDRFRVETASRHDVTQVPRETFLSRPYDRAMMQRQARQPTAMPVR